MIRFWDSKLSGAPPLLSFSVRPQEGTVMASLPGRCARCGLELPAELPVPGTLLCPACQRQELEQKKSARESWRKGIIALTVFTAPLAVPGLAALFAPYAMWYVGEGWQYQNLEPSEAKLALIRIGGGGLLLVLAIFWVVILRNRPDPELPGARRRT